MADEKKKSLWQEFKEFAFKGNVMDMAIGVVIGGAFSPIVTSLVNDIIMPPIGFLIGGVDFSDLKIAIGDASINYGSFIQTVLNFFIIAICIFAMIKLINKGSEIATRKKRAEEEARKKAEEEAKANEPKAPTTEELLGEIRDLLAAKK